MSNSDEQGPGPDQHSDESVGATPAALPERSVEGKREDTLQWDLGAAPSREIAVGGGDVGAAPEGPRPLVEPPTLPLPIESQELQDSQDSAEIDIEEVEDVSEDIDEMEEVGEIDEILADPLDGATPVPGAPFIPSGDDLDHHTPPPMPVTSAELPRVPPMPVSALDSALRTASEWAEPLSERPRRKRAKPWYEEVFDEDYLRTLPFMTAEQTLREVNFIHEMLTPPANGSLLDVGCGYGRHAIELAQRGLSVTGIDLSLPLLIRAADESQRRSLNVNFVHADMRELSFDSQFDGAYCMLTSFGYFDEETNLKVASGIYRALKPGGRLLLDTLNRDYVVADLPTRVWWEGDSCVVLEEVDFNFHTSRVGIRRSIVFSEGRQVEQDMSIRAYSLHELGRLLRQAGFRVVDVSGSLATRGRFFGATSRNLLVVCEKPPH